MSPNALERRFRRMAKVLVDEKQLETQPVTFGLKFVLDRRQPAWIRIVCSILVIISSSLLLYQIVDRFLYYLSYPVEVDVHIETLQTIAFPQIKIEFPFTKEVNAMMPTEFDFIQGACSYPFMYFMLKNISNVTEMWKAANTSSIITKHEIVHGKEVTQMQMISVPTPMSTAVVLYSESHFSTKGKTTSVLIQLDKTVNNHCLERKIQKCESEFWTELAAIFMTYGKGLISESYRIEAELETVRRSNEFLRNYEIAMKGISFTAFDGEYDYQNHGDIITERRWKIGLRKNQYHFINRHSSPCTKDEESYKKCEQECRLSLYKSQSCNFPFMPRETGLPVCDRPEEYNDAWNIFEGTDPRSVNCSCVHPCTQTFYEFFAVAEDKTELAADIIIQYLDNYVEIIAERQAYDFLSFLADTGGNMGLCLGLSILDLIYWFYYLVMKNRAQKSQVFTPEDPIFKIVRKVFSSITRYNLKTPQDGSYKIARIRIMFILIFTLLTCSFLLMRLEFFFRFPTLNTLTVKDYIFVQYPVVTLCWESIFLRKKRNSLARKNKSFSDVCKISLLDLMEPPLSYTAHRIWRDSASHDIILSNATMRKDIKITTSLLPYGNCTTYSSGLVSHADTAYDFAVGRLKSTLLCDASVKVFLTQPNDIIDPNNFELFTEASVSLLQFTLKIIQNNEVSEIPEGKVNAVHECKRKCIVQKMLFNLKCSLPYIRITSHHLHPCNTTAEAKKAEAIYMDAFASTDPHRDCACPRKFQEFVYTPIMLLSPIEIKITISTFLLVNTRIETLLKISAYNTGKLVSEIGSIVSCFLGLSVISLAEVICKLCQKCFTRYY